MVDHTDDWMHPELAKRYSLDDTKPELRPFLIQRERTVICSWVGSGPPTEWKQWSAHKTREERDAELKRLRTKHPAWRLRPAHEHGPDGFRHVDVEDEEADLLRRLQEVRRKSKSNRPARPLPFSGEA